MAITPILTIARNTLVESIRQPICFMLILASGLLQVINTWITGFSMGYSKVPGEVTGDNKLLFDISLATVFGCGILLAAFIATSVVSREIERKTVLTVVSKPVGRTTVILGKYLGVCATMLIATSIMVLFVLVSIRHGVLTTAADDPDQPVILFSAIAIFGSVLLAAVFNYLYGWSFGQSLVLMLLPAMLVAYVLVLLISKKWQIQPITTDLKPQITLACACLAMALLVMSAIAVAASTRLGQVMTIVVCAGVFILGLLSNHFIGRHVFVNQRIGEVSSSQCLSSVSIFSFHADETLELAAERAGLPVEEFQSQNLRVQDYVDAIEVVRMPPINDEVYRDTMFREPGSTYRITLSAPATGVINVGDALYYGAAPNGVGMSVPAFNAPEPGLAPNAQGDIRTSGPAVVVTAIEDLSITIQQTGPTAVPVRRPPLPEDSIFQQSTRVRALPLAAWSLIPNMHVFYLVDAISQNQLIPPRHVLLIAIYALLQIAAALSIATMLFQTRDVG